VDLFAPRIKTSLASLRANLPTRIGVFNAEANGVQLTVPADDAGALSPPRPELAYVFGGQPRHGMGEYPVVEVAIPDALVDNLSIQHIEGDLSSSIVVAIWAGRTSGEDFPTVYEKVLGYSRCITEVLLVPDAIYPRETVTRIRYAFAANPDKEQRDEMETFTFGGFIFFTTDGIAARP
jgi:hypothetical protein